MGTEFADEIIQERVPIKTDKRATSTCFAIADASMVICEVRLG